MRIAVTGARGFIGRATVAALREAEHEVVPARRGAGDGLRWSLAGGFDPPGALDGFDAVIHLAGESIAGRWTPQRKAAIRDSRIQGTAAVVDGLRQASSPPPTLICASAIGLYGARGDEELDEDAAAGTGFLPDVVTAWETEARRAESLGVRVVCLRFGIVLGRAGGALASMLPVFRLGLGGKLGAGDQFMSWVHIDDVVGAVELAVTNADVRGPVNVTAPTPVTNRAFTKALGRALRRPTWLPVPAGALRAVLGEMADPLLLSGARVIPKALQTAGYRFAFGDLDAALSDLVG